MLAPARALALALPAVLLGSVLAMQYLGGFVPCEMCHWQRWPHYAALAAAVLAILLRASAASRPLTILAGLLIMASGVIGVFHAGVEYGWWPGPAHCTAPALSGSGDMLRQILAAPLVRCDVPQWTLFGVSLAGWNALFSLAGGATVLILATRRPR